MTYTVTRLINDAYELAGLLSPGLNTITYPQLNTGLRLLNSFLAMKSVNDRLIPYYKKYEFNTIVNQESYLIPKLIYAETLTFDYSTVRFSVVSQTRKQFQGTSRANGIDSLMQSWYQERELGGTRIFFYFLPDKIYPVTIWGKFSLDSVALNQDLEQTVERYYIEYMRYGLGELICHDNNVTFQSQHKLKLEEYEKLVTDVSPPDLSLQKISGLRGQGMSIWSFVNLSHGWLPP